MGFLVERENLKPLLMVNFDGFLFALRSTKETVMMFPEMNELIPWLIYGKITLSYRVKKLD